MAQIPGFKEVTQEEFYRAIGPHDAIVSLRGDWPYTSLFTLRQTQRLLGKIVEEWTDDVPQKRPIVKKYLLVDPQPETRTHSAS